ncbi:MAG: dihydropteroate synthase, partial [Chitinophagaceae bacterium]
PVVMGILNATPDSFFEQSRNLQVDTALATADKMLNEGATIIDIGGQSTRPGAEKLSADEELLRVIPIIEKLHSHFPELIISIDTFYAKVANQAVAAGASIVNDISAGNLDAPMLATVAANKVPFIAMHMLGSPQTMQQHTNYNNLTTDIADYFIQTINKCQQAGINDIILDPGFGFSKTLEQNYSLLKNLSAFHFLNKPLLIGISRKSMIYKALNSTANDALNGTNFLHAFALQNGAAILRVHDVKPAVEAIKLWSLYHNAPNQ